MPKNILFVSDLEKVIEQIKKLGYDTTKTRVVLGSIVPPFSPDTDTASKAEFRPDQHQSLCIR